MQPGYINFPDVTKLVRAVETNHYETLEALSKDIDIPHMRLWRLRTSAERLIGLEIDKGRDGTYRVKQWGLLSRRRVMA